MDIRTIKLSEVNPAKYNPRKELNAHYCDVIIKRWENFTGCKAEKDGRKNV